MYVSPVRASYCREAAGVAKGSEVLMGEALFDLEQLLRAKKEKLTPQEANLLLSCKSKSVRNFAGSALAGGAAIWAATRKFTLSAGAGGFFGLWIFSRSLYYCADHILTLDGSILQKELANIMVTKYQNDPSLMQLISKHFYSERIFDDSTSNTPKLRWRYRNFYSDNVVHGNRTYDHDSHDESQSNSPNDSYDKSQGYSRTDSHDKSQGKSENATDSKRTSLETKQFFVRPDLDVMSEADPLDYLFGYGAPVEEILHPNTPKKSPGMHGRGHRRYHRRRRMRNHDDLSDSEYAAAV